MILEAQIIQITIPVRCSIVPLILFIQMSSSEVASRLSLISVADVCRSQTFQIVLVIGNSLPHACNNKTSGQRILTKGRIAGADSSREQLM